MVAPLGRAMVRFRDGNRSGLVQVRWICTQHKELPHLMTGMGQVGFHLSRLAFSNTLWIVFDYQMHVGLDFGLTKTQIHPILIG